MVGRQEYLDYRIVRVLLADEVMHLESQIYELRMWSCMITELETQRNSTHLSLAGDQGKTLILNMAKVCSYHC